MHHPDLLVRRLSPDAILPEYHSTRAAGLDLRVCLPDTPPVELPPHHIRLFPTGIAVAIPDGYEGQIRPRSGLACRHAVTIPNAPGTIDSDYRGEIRVALINLSSEPFLVEHAMRVAQLVIAPVARASVVEVTRLDETARADSGFGSTGLH